MAQFLYILITIVCMLPMAACNSQSEEDRFLIANTQGKKIYFSRPKIQLWMADVKTTFVINNGIEWSVAFNQTSIERKELKPLPSPLSLPPDVVDLTRQTIVVAFSGESSAKVETKIISVYKIENKIVVNVVENYCSQPGFKYTQNITHPADAVVIEKSTKPISFNVKQTKICPQLEWQPNMTRD